jgi:hypothetical protein
MLNMKNIKYQTFLVIALSIYAGLIFNDCVMRVLDSLARHGHIVWADVIYITKVVLIATTYLSYRYISKIFTGVENSSYKSIISKNIIPIFLLAIASAFVFSQYSLFNAFVVPIKVLFLLWPGL